MLKKILPVLICAITIFSSFNGCSQGIKYNAYTVLQCETDEAEVVWPAPNVVDYSGPSEVSVTVNGVKYVGSYKESRSSLSAYYETDHVFAGDGFEFYIRASDGKFTYLNIKNVESSGSLLDNSRLKQIADSIADDYISLGNCYVEKIQNSNFRYYRIVQDHLTAEWVYVDLDSSGNLVGIVLSDPGAFDNVKKLEINEQKADKAVEEKVNKISEPKTSNGWKMNYNIRERILTRTANDQCALQYDIDIEYKSTNGLGHGGEIVTLLVIVDHQKFNPFKP